MKSAAVCCGILMCSRVSNRFPLLRRLVLVDMRLLVTVYVFVVLRCLDSIEEADSIVMSDAVKHGRRALGNDELQQSTSGDAPRPVVKGWGEDTLVKEETVAMASPTGGSDPVDLPSLDAGVDEATNNHQRVEEDEALAREVATAPVEYHSAMPKLSELDLGVKWSKIHAKCNEEMDMTCLTNVLSQHLDDEDTAWVPDILLVQLTSELLDVAEQREEEVSASPNATGAGAPGTLEGMSRKRSVKA
jgi:hypothetical protein